ncbi:unnamed protein product [Caenorhabditis brenneri]
MDSCSEDSDDDNQPLHFALSQLQRKEALDDYDGSSFPKPSKITAAAEKVNNNLKTTDDILDALVDYQDDYPKTVQVMMNKGLLKKRQNCRKCGKPMLLRRRKNAYEWRCRKRNSHDCSTSSIKMGSWYEFTKHSFKIMLNFMIMHGKNCSIEHMAEQLNFSIHNVSEICRYGLELTEKIENRYPKIGQNGEEVITEVVTLKPKKPMAEQYHVLTGQELGSSRCFAILLPDLEEETIENIKRKKIHENAKVTTVKTTLDDYSIHHGDPNVQFFNEEEQFEKHHRLCTKMRNDQPEYIYTNKCISAWVKEQAVRKTEGPKTLDRLVEELMAYTA